MATCGVARGVSRTQAQGVDRERERKRHRRQGRIAQWRFAHEREAIERLERASHAIDVHACQRERAAVRAGCHVDEHPLTAEVELVGQISLSDANFAVAVCTDQLG